MEIPANDLAKASVGEQYANMVISAPLFRDRQVRLETMVGRMGDILGKSKARFKDTNVRP